MNIKYAYNHIYGNTLGFFITSFVLLFSFLNSFTVVSQDRNLGFTYKYPDDVFFHNASENRVYDVTKPPFNAIPNDGIDDTDAFIAAYDAVLARMDPYGWDVSGSLSAEASFIIYIPNGVYNISKPIIYSGAARASHPSENLARIRFIGESRAGTVLRLANNASGYGAGTNTPVLSFAKQYFNNAVAFNYVRNMTINTGSGNPGAVGVNMCGANTSGVSNVKIISEDGSGSVGLDVKIGPTHGYYYDIDIEGFDVGVKVTPYHHTAIFFEYISLSNQNNCGFEIENGSATIRKLKSTNQVPALKVTDGGGHAIILDSELDAGSASSTAMSLETGELFARNIAINGYASAVYKTETSETIVVDDVATNTLTEYVSGITQSLRDGQEMKSMNLPIEDNPENQWEQDLSNWVSVGASSVTASTNRDAIQNAMNSGKSTVYFPSASYVANSANITIPSSVEHINMMFAQVTGTFVVFGDSNDPPLFIEDGAHNSTRIVQRGTRKIVVSCHHALSYTNNISNETPGDLFVNNCLGFGVNNKITFDGGQNVWIRYINRENIFDPNFTIDDAQVVVLSYKTEGNMTSFVVQNGGALEVLGGIANEWRGDSTDWIPNPNQMINDNSNLSYVGCTNGLYDFYNIIKEVSGTEESFLLRPQFPIRYVAEIDYDGNPSDRRPSTEDIFIPLYVSYSTGSLSTEELVKDNDSIKLSVDKVNSKLHILSPKTFTEGNLYNINGQLLKKIDTNEIDISSLSNGVYIINIEGSSKKFVKL